MFCKYCGKELEEDVVICTACGRWVGEAPPTELAKKINTSEKTTYCKYCGAETEEGAVVCTMCGRWIKDIPSSELEKEEKELLQGNGMAVAGFVCSFLVPILGWIFGGIGLSRSAKRKGKGKGLSIAAIVIATIMFFAYL